MKSRVLLLVILIFLSLNSCKKSSESKLQPEAVLTSSSDCKDSSSARFSAYNYEQLGETLYYYFDENSKELILLHRNVTFNCEPGVISAEFAMNGSSEIIVDEHEEKSEADCLCMRNLNFRLINISKQIYKIVIRSPYRSAEYSFTVDLTSNSHGTVEPD